MAGRNSVHTSNIKEGTSESSIHSCHKHYYGHYGILSQSPFFQSSKQDFTWTSVPVLVSLLPPPFLPKTNSKSSAITLTKLLNSFHVFPRVYAADVASNTNDSATNVNVEDKKQTSSGVLYYNSAGGKHPYEALARLYIEKETGRERVRAIFKKNHKGESSPQLFYIKLSLTQICIISFLMRYVPSWKLAKENFIRENNATAFRTSIDAVRRMNDAASLKAVLDGATFATKITLFSAGFLLLSQGISSYRNRTSILDYTIAAGVTGGLARLQMGPKGFVAGSFVGVVLGTICGCVASAALHLSNLTEDARHLQDTIAKLEVERSIIGVPAFEEKMQKLLSELDSAPSVS